MFNNLWYDALIIRWIYGLTMDIKEQQALLESLAKKKSEVDSRIARLEAHKETALRQWEEKSAQLKEEFGTDNLTEIKDRLEKEKAENEKKLLACQSQLIEVEQAVANLEKLLADNG